MKKYFYSVLVMAIFAIGFAASSDDSSSNSSLKTEQAHESEAEPQTQTQESEAERQTQKQEKIEKAKERGRYWSHGHDGNGESYSRLESNCKYHFMHEFGTPSTDEDFEMYKAFKDAYMEEQENKRRAEERMDNM